ncbi:MAG: alpha-amylase family protein [Paludibacter sp.]|jgi:glycosidase|nr:alpha-amylase family protein [Paludibacter sp.]
MSKFTIYQVLPRLFGSYTGQNLKNGSIEENGCGKFNYFTADALQSIKDLGVTHIWFTGILEHATKTDYSEVGIRPDHPGVVKGKAGSAYAIKDYYDVDPDLAESVPDRMKEFEDLVKRTHHEEMKVIIDFVPNHLAREYASDKRPEGVNDFGANDDPERAFSPANNFYYFPGQAFQPQFDTAGYTEFPAKATGNDQFSAFPGINDWYETVKLNYGVDYGDHRRTYFDPIPDTWLKMKEILLFWASKKVDGFRCDMAEMVPVEFWEWAIASVKQQYPDVLFIAEVYNPAEYRNYLFRGGFDYLYDKVGLYDTLRAVITHQQSASAITHCWQALDGIADRMLNFLENHDEQRIASDFFAGDAQKALPALVVAATLTNGPFMVYAGQELGEPGMDEEGFSGRDGRTTIFDYWRVQSLQNWANEGKFNDELLTGEQLELRAFYRRLLNLVITEKVLQKGEMYDLNYANLQNDLFNPHRQYTFFRKSGNELLLIVANFDQHAVSLSINIPSEALSYLQLPETGTYQFSNLLQEGAVINNGVLSSATPFRVNIEASSAVLLKLIRQF